MIYSNTSAVPVEDETLKLGRDETTTDAGRTNVKVEIFMQIICKSFKVMQKLCLFKCIIVDHNLWSMFSY